MTQKNHMDVKYCEHTEIQMQKAERKQKRKVKWITRQNMRKIFWKLCDCRLWNTFTFKAITLRLNHIVSLKVYGRCLWVCVVYCICINGIGSITSISPNLETEVGHFKDVYNWTIGSSDKHLMPMIIWNELGMTKLQKKNNNMNWNESICHSSICIYINISQIEKKKRNKIKKRKNRVQWKWNVQRTCRHIFTLPVQIHSSNQTRPIAKTQSNFVQMRNMCFV